MAKKYRYRVVYVGDDSMDHSMIVRAVDRHAAAAEAKRQGAEYVTSVKPSESQWPWILFCILAFLAIIVIAVV